MQVFFLKASLIDLIFYPLENIFQVSVPIVSNEKCKNMFLAAGRHEVMKSVNQKEINIQVEMFSSILFFSDLSLILGDSRHFHVCG